MAWKHPFDNGSKRLLCSTLMLTSVKLSVTTGALVVPTGCECRCGQDTQVLTCCCLESPVLTHMHIRDEQGLQIVFYGDDVVESWRGSSAGKACPACSGVPTVWGQHFGGVYRAQSYGIAGVALHPLTTPAFVAIRKCFVPHICAFSGQTRNMC